MHYLLILALSLLLIGCHSSPHIDEMVTKFSADQDALDRLRTMIQEDRGDRACFVIGEDRIADFRFYPGRRNVSVALEQQGLTRERYDEYLSLLAAVGGYEVGQCSGPDGGETTIVMKVGAAVGPGPCLTSYVINDDESIPEGRVRDKGFDKSIEITPLADGWYIEYGCDIPEPALAPRNQT